MNLVDRTSREAQIAWATRLHQLLRDDSQLAAADDVEQAIRQYQDSRFVLAVLGKAKRGKSTLINALLGRRDDLAAPIDKLPASSAISCFRWAEAEEILVQFRDGRCQPIQLDQVRDYVTEESNPENAKGVDLVDVRGPFPGLDRDVELVDTPGAGSLHEHHDALLRTFIPQADAVIFLVTARMPLDQDELELLRQIKAAEIRKVFLAINRIDESDERDIRAAVQHTESLLAEAGIGVERIYRISAKRAFLGDLDESGLPDLLHDIGQLLGQAKGQVLDARLKARVLQAAQPVLDGLETKLESSRKSEDELQADLNELERQQRESVQRRSLATKQFQLRWDRATDTLVTQLKQAQDEVDSAVQQRIASASLSGVSKLAQELPSLLQDEMDARLQPLMTRFESEAQEATAELQDTYHGLELHTAPGRAVRTRDLDIVLKQAAGLGAVTALGGSLVVTGSAAAASIAAANAAALAGTTGTVVAPSILSTLLSIIPSASWLAPLATGTATASAPVALTTTPLWVAMSGPVGWTLVGLGTLAVPFAWRTAKLKSRDQLEKAAQEQVRHIFDRLDETHLPALRKMADSIVAEFELRLDRQLQQTESAIQQALYQRPTENEIAQLEDRTARLRRELVNNEPALTA